jgi:hypothetical protein
MTPKFISNSSTQLGTNDITKLNNNNNISKVNSNKQNNNYITSTSPSTGSREVSCQTLSTGDIVMMKVFFEEEQNADSTLMSSPKRDK